MSSLCSEEKCNRKVFDKNEKCVLHCEKKDYSFDFHNSGILGEFNDKLIDYISSNLFDYGIYKETATVNKQKVRDYLKGTDCTEEVKEFIKDKTVVFSEIFFPCRDNRDYFDYHKTLKKLKAIHFNYCQFSAHSINIEELEMFYQDCVFNDYWSISRVKLLSNHNNVLYQQCHFRNEITVYVDDNNEGKLDNSLFNDCKFDKKLSFGNIILEKPVFNNSEHFEMSIPTLEISNCKFESKFTPNKLISESVSIIDSEFESKFEFKECDTSNFELINTNIAGIFDCYKTRFGVFNSFKNVLSDFVGFEVCEFGSQTNKQTKFTYTTFLDFVSFRNAKFNTGLDIETTNLKESPNFLNIRLNKKDTTRATLRIIKDSFDKSGNHLDANNFFVWEMKKYKKELDNKPFGQEKVIFWLNEKTSNFGQNYILPIKWLIFFACLYYVLTLGHDANLLYKMAPSANGFISTVSNLLNHVAAGIIPFSKLLREGMEFLSLIFYAIYASLIWQTIVALKRHTKR